jgi:hypothetical protein
MMLAGFNLAGQADHDIAVLGPVHAHPAIIVVEAFYEAGRDMEVGLPRFA